MSNTTDLRAALDAAISDLTAARALLTALTPAMDEPKWPIVAPAGVGGRPSGRTRVQSEGAQGHGHRDAGE